MSEPQPADERLRGLLGGLSPAARALITRGLQPKAGPAEAPPPASGPPTLVVAEKRAEKPSPATELARAFFSPISIFVNAPTLLHRETGRVTEEAVGLVWGWICRDLAKDAVAAALAALPTGAADLMGPAADLRARILPALASLLSSIGDAPLAQQRLSAQIGGDRSYRDLAGIEAAFRQVPWVTQTLRQMPPRLTRRNLEEDPGLLAPIEAALITPRGDAAWLFSALLPRLESPTMLARIAVALTGSDSAEKIARSPVAPALDILVSEIELEVARLRRSRADRRSADAAEQAILRYHALQRELGALVDLGTGSRWGTRLALVRKLATAELAPEVSEAGGLARRAFRQRAATGAVMPVDPELIEDAERALRFLKVASNTRESFALNSILASVRREVDQAFEVLVDPLLHEVRTAFGEAKELAIRRADAAVRLAEVYLGADHAASLRRSRLAAAEERRRL